MMSAEEVKTQLEQKLEIAFGQQKTDGDPAYVRVHKGGAEIYMSPEQARALAKKLNEKLS